jgi:hypothetical protein
MVASALLRRGNFGGWSDQLSCNKSHFFNRFPKCLGDSSCRTPVRSSSDPLCPERR